MGQIILFHNPHLEINWIETTIYPIVLPVFTSIGKSKLFRASFLKGRLTNSTAPAENANQEINEEHKRTKLANNTNDQILVIQMKIRTL